MSQELEDLLRTLNKDYGKQYDQGASGQSPGGNWDTDLPINLEYRAKVTKSEYKDSKSGRKQIVLTYEISEPEEYAGTMIQQYVDPKPTQTWQLEQLSKLFGALQADLTMTGNFEAFVADFEDRSVVLTVQKWGEANDRNGVRWVNADRGQTLKTNVAPPKAKTNTSNLRPDIQIPKDPEPAQETVVSPPKPAAPPLPGGAQSSGVNLPPGLR